MDKKKKLGAFVSNAGKTAKGALGNALKSVDQNDDGKFDLSDVSVIAGTVGSTVKKGALAAKGTAEEKARLLELKTLQPIFAGAMDDAISLDDANFLMPKFIRVANRDKKHAESEVCQGSIGYASNQNGLYVVNIFRDSIDAFGLTFYPDCDSEFYYVDPCDKKHYIALDKYFSYLKIVRINELKALAQDLGAKHFKVTYMEEKSSFLSKAITASANAVDAAKADTTHTTVETKYSALRIEAETDLPGHPPMEPQLKYLQKDPTVQGLISMRMKEPSSPSHEKYMVEMSLSSGMNKDDAAKIDSVVDGLKIFGGATFAHAAKKEAKGYLEYDIEF